MPTPRRRHLRLPLRPAHAEGLLRRARLRTGSAGRRRSSAPIARPDALHDVRGAAEGRGVQLFIGAAGLAAHLPGVLASADRAAGDRHAARRRRAGWRRCALRDRPDAARRAGGGGGHRLAPGRRTPATSPPASWRWAMRPWPSGSRPSATTQARPRRTLRIDADARMRPVIDRYALPELREIFGERRKLELWLRIELLAAEALHAGRRGARPRTGSGSVGAGRERGRRRRGRARSSRSRSTTSSPSCARVTERLGPGGPLAALRADELRRARHRHRGHAARRDRGRRAPSCQARGDRAAPGAPASRHADGRAQPRHPCRADHVRLQGGRLVRRAGSATRNALAAGAGSASPLARSPARSARMPT